MVPAYSNAPQALKTPSKLRFAFGEFSEIDVFILFESPWGYRSLVPTWGHIDSSIPLMIGSVWGTATPRRPPLEDCRNELGEPMELQGKFLPSTRVSFYPGRAVIVLVVIVGFPLFAPLGKTAIIFFARTPF